MTSTSPFLSVLFLVASTAVTSPAPAVEAEAADLVVLGRVLTVDGGMSVAEGLAAKRGRIVAVGAKSDVERWIGPATEVLRLERGQVAMPGFIEAHGHFLGLGDTTMQLDLRPMATWDEIVAAVAATAATAKPGEWIRGRGWHQEKWTRPPEPSVEGFPLHASLSAVSPHNPVRLVHASGHGTFVNAKALELAGIDDATPDPPGGTILRGADGKATGFLRELADELVERAMTLDGEELDRRRIVAATEECLANGVTSFHDAGSSLESIRRLERAADDGLLGVRLFEMVYAGGPALLDGDGAVAAREELRRGLAAAKVRGYAGGLVTVGGIKVQIDGALGSRGAWLLEPYSDAPESVGLPLASPSALAAVAEIAVLESLQLAVHAIGDRANREVLDVFEKAFVAHPKPADRRWRVEHAQHLHPDDIPRFGRLGVIASMQAVHCTSDGPWVPQRLGAKRSVEGAYVWRRLLDSGAVVINGTDVPVEEVDPIANFAAAVTRRMGNGEAFHPEQAMTRAEALAAATRAAAWAVFEEREKGTLEVGKLADLAVLSQDLLTVPAERLAETRVLTTVVGGRVVYRAP